jgi:hypothetical protein
MQRGTIVRRNEIPGAPGFYGDIIKWPVTGYQNDFVLIHRSMAAHVSSRQKDNEQKFHI